MVSAANDSAPTTFTGAADRANTKVSTDHPPSVARANLFQCGVGAAYVTPTVNECRMSKSEFRRPIFGLAIKLGAFENPEHDQPPGANVSRHELGIILPLQSLVL
jgi:hypothetical protein